MSAIISECGLYRYRLERDFGPHHPSTTTIAWLMVNPSTADAIADDSTIRKVIGFTKRIGARRFIVGNLFAFRSKNIRDLRTAADPIGPDADHHCRQIISDADMTIVAWGPRAKLPRHLRERWKDVAALAQATGRPLMCLGVAKDGQPLHPLMLSYRCDLRAWSPPT